MEKNKLALKIALIAICTAIVTVFTIAIQIPVGKEYLNFSDVAIVFIAFAFGPVPGLIAGGLGPAIGDIISGYASWAPISLAVHGLEGLAVGLLASRIRSPRLLMEALTTLVDIAIVAFGYYLLGALFITDFRTSLTGVPINILQGVSGGVIGILLYEAVHKAYRKIDDLRW